MLKPDRALWSIQDALELYNINNWGKGYFSINKQGHMTVHPDKDPERCIDLKEVIDSLRDRGLACPLLIRFPDLLKHRLAEIHQAFNTAIEDHEFQNRYHYVYPIKVNQQRHLVEDLLRFGRAYDFWLEAGSKPELLAVLALTNASDTPIICNGFKDDQYIEMTVLATKMGKTIIPVIEKFTELIKLVKYAKHLNVRPVIGLRAKLSSRGAGRWEASSGLLSKFGLTTAEILQVVAYLQERNMLDCLQLLHFHIGSQISNIRNIKNALNEAARIYVALIRNGAGIRYMDVGGGLGVDYDGSQTNFESSVNYTLEEYANDVVHHISSICNETGVAHPAILSESGRALMAYHSILVFNVLGVSSFDGIDIPGNFHEESPKPLHDLLETFNTIGNKNFQEAYHDAMQSKDESIHMFSLGYMTLEERGKAESLFWAICRKISRIIVAMDYVPDELEGLEHLLADVYFCNYSCFQSMPDSWAIKQLFPITPIHRLDTRPTCRGILADITCDSDGKVDKFIDLRDVKKYLELHPFTGHDYYLAAYLVGAYQEILGDLHNLFGDTHMVHVRLEDDGEINVDTVVKGDTVREVLHYVQYSADELLERIRRETERAVRKRTMTVQESTLLLTRYASGLEGYTYLGSV